MFEKIKKRYLKYYVTEEQLARYVALGAINEEQAEEINAARSEQGGSGNA